MDMTFKLQVFEGPLDLLLYLIEKNKVNIYDIPIVEITAQYMEYVNRMKKDNLDTLSEFLVMAATLLDIKSKMLLPKKEEEEFLCVSLCPPAGMIFPCFRSLQCPVRQT